MQTRTVTNHRNHTNGMSSHGHRMMRFGINRLAHIERDAVAHRPAKTNRFQARWPYYAVSICSEEGGESAYEAYRSSKKRCKVVRSGAKWCRR